MFHVKLEKFYPQKMFRSIIIRKKYFPGNKILLGNNFFNMNSGEFITYYIMNSLILLINIFDNKILNYYFDSDLN